MRAAAPEPPALYENVNKKLINVPFLFCRHFVPLPLAVLLPRCLNAFSRAAV